MGGISLSALKDVPFQPYASWSGICRTDGGGFCGMRTLPFQDKPLLKEAKDQDNTDGLYLEVKRKSDDEPQRRMWKVTVRTDSSRGETVYNAPFDLAAFAAQAKEKNDEWTRVKVPFETFQQVRGPRLIVDGPKLDLEGGIFQIGMTLSKFKIAVNTTVLDDFRAGYFELLIRQIGFYKDEEEVVEEDVKEVEVAEKEGSEVEVAETEQTLEQAVKEAVKEIEVPDTLSKKEAEKKRPLPLKILLPIAKLLFSENANRRKSAMGILRNKRNMTRSQAILFGIKSRAKSIGWIPSIGKTVGILSVDSFRGILKNFLKVLLLVPFRLVGKVVVMVKKALGMKVKPSLKE
jgi:hypothetical protein